MNNVLAIVLVSHTLSWSANSEPDLSHYRVYKDGAVIGYTAEASFPISANGIYEITALDVSGNESPRSMPVTFDQNSPRRVRSLSVNGRGDTAVVALGDTVSIAFEVTNMLENGVTVQDTSIYFAAFYRYKGTATWMQIGQFQRSDRAGTTVASLYLGTSVVIELMIHLRRNGVMSLDAAPSVFVRTLPGLPALWKSKRIRLVI